MYSSRISTGITHCQGNIDKPANIFLTTVTGIILKSGCNISDYLCLGLQLGFPKMSEKIKVILKSHRSFSIGQLGSN